MTSREALSLLDQVCSRFSGTREDHQNIQMAMGVLNRLVVAAEVSDTQEENEKEIESLTNIEEDQKEDKKGGNK